MVNRKKYVDYEKQMRKCVNCFRILPFGRFHLIDGYRPHSYCKTCARVLNRNRILEKKLKLFPKFYSNCDECGEIYKNSLGHDCKGEE